MLFKPLTMRSPLKPSVCLKPPLVLTAWSFGVTFSTKPRRAPGDLIEVKSSSKVKDEHQWDLALQKYVLTKVGLPISATKLMHINTQTCSFPNR